MMISWSYMLVQSGLWNICPELGHFPKLLCFKDRAGLSSSLPNWYNWRRKEQLWSGVYLVKSITNSPIQQLQFFYSVHH